MNTQEKRQLAADHLARLIEIPKLIEDLSVKEVIDLMVGFQEEVEQKCACCNDKA
jgi:hypothetical protein